MSEDTAGQAPGPESGPGAGDDSRPVSPPPEDAPDSSSQRPTDERAKALGRGAEEKGQAERPDLAEGPEKKLDDTFERASWQERQVRDDIPTGDAGATFNLHDEASAEFIAGRDVHIHRHISFTGAGGSQHTRGPVGVSDLTYAARVHVQTASDETLRVRCAADRVVILRGRLESGRRSSAIAALDGLTGTRRDQSLVSLLEGGTGLGGLTGRLAEGHGHLLDASDADWLEELGEARVSEIRDVLDQGRGYLIVLATAAAAPPPHVALVDHESPDPGRVIRSHLAACQAGAREVRSEDLAAAEVLLREALSAFPEVRQWEQELTSRSAPGAATPPADAVLLAVAITEWARGRDAGDASAPRIGWYRNLRLHRQARVLLGRGDRNDAPLRQAYALATAALDGMAVSEVADQARKLAALLDKAEGGSRKRRVFAETLSHWLGHTGLAHLVQQDRDGTDVTVVQMRNRRLARIIVEVAWLDYDAAREPVRSWLVRICEEHHDRQVRVRAAQALAFIAVRDFPYVRTNVLNAWSESDRAVEHQAAAWLLEAAVAGDVPGGRIKDQVDELLRRWSRLTPWQKRAIAVRAYGTKIGTRTPEAARSGIRISAADPYFRTLPELALGELYAGGQHGAVMQELAFWTYASPVTRERVGRALVRVAWVRHADQPECYDLLWRMAHQPTSAGIKADALGRLWKIACEQQASSGAAWRMLGLWAKSSRSDPAQWAAFTRLADSFEKAVHDRDLRERFGVHRRQWNDYRDKEFTR